MCGMAGCPGVGGLKGLFLHCTSKLNWSGNYNSCNVLVLYVNGTELTNNVYHFRQTDSFLRKNQFLILVKK